jgi:hypothetical protein
MMSVLPGSRQSFCKTEVNQCELESAIKGIEKLIRGTSPLVDEVIVINSTKFVHVDIAFASAKVYITITNPKDDETFQFV